MPNIRKKQTTLEDVVVGFDKAETTMTFIQRMIDDLNILLNTSLPFSSALPFISVLILILLLMLDSINTALDDTKPVSTRIFKATLALVIIFAAITTLIVAAPYIGYIITSSIAARRLWDVGVALFNWITSPTAIDENRKRELRGTIAEKTHMLVMSAITIAGLVLISNPVTFIAGISILLGVAAYLVVDKFLVINKINYNPVRWLGRTIFGDAFTAPEKVELKSDRIFELQPFNTKSILVATKTEPTIKKSSPTTPKPVVARPVEKPAVYNSIFGRQLGSNVEGLHNTMRLKGLNVRTV